MGLRNSAQSFQRLLDSVLAGMEDTYAYMDDILIFSKSESDHLNTLDERGNPPLFYAVVNSNVQCVKALLELGANANVVGRYGNTPLHIAMMKKDDTDSTELIINMLLNNEHTRKFK